MAYFLQQIANALPIASLYAALAFGYAVAFAVTRRADITYGAIFAFSGHIYLLFAHLGWDRLWLVLTASLALGAAAGLMGGLGAGVIIGQFVMRPLSAASPNAMIVASLGLVMVLMEGARLASDTRELWLPPFLNANIVFWRGAGFPVALTVLQLINIALMSFMVLAGHMVLGYSRFGRRWRAVSDDPLAAELSGVSAARIFVSAYALAAFYASVCGVLATSYYGTMDFGAGLLFGLKVVLIAAAGGHSSPLKSAAGAALVGLAETLWSGYGPIFWRDLVVISGLVLLLVLSRRERLTL
ncbi:branched-chain amino acid ABC transporter permease [Aliirhizobium smilacinae]|uniref:Branched-chain amino acid ABC transporter permease n=1 Tax=Aliirhizobium smilacinae TaxID=1395944 RepID=A0A5C4XPW3_9HYPH|nr:branched-chain amino acid ABC transporter permease [Rhizobium smilacinae]TNM65482.1 branched-chain amino acid ABC transporter permease [Rhizobium smilacinae]